MHTYKVGLVHAELYLVGRKAFHARLFVNLAPKDTTVSRLPPSTVAKCNMLLLATNRLSALSHIWTPCTRHDCGSFGVFLGLLLYNCLSFEQVANRCI
jgi:hypothetical protein